MWWVEGSLNSVTLGRQALSSDLDLDGCLTLGCGSPSLGLSFLLCIIGRLVVPTLESCGENEMKENGSWHMGSAQTMSSMVMSLSFLSPERQDVGSYH